MKNPFEKLFNSGQKKPEVVEISKADRLIDLRLRRERLIDDMKRERHPDDVRVLEDIDKKISELENQS